MSITWRHVSLALLVVSWMTVLSAPAYAQSAIAGVVTDETRGVLPGVTVEAASPALIEQVRTAITDAQGRYTIVDLRPGTYTVTFSLQGFTTVVREGIELSANFTAPVNVMLTVGGIEESLTVSGASPVVDVQNVQRTQVLQREVLDAIPTARNIQSIGALISGIKISSPDVGGAQGMQQTYMAVHGASATHNTIQVDGMMVNGIEGDGRIQNYFNDAMNQEVSYQTSGISSEVSSGGVRLNMIPREGGNAFSGALFAGGVSGAWQADNFTQELKDKGLLAVDRIDRIYDVNVSQGGPIQRDRLWFFGTFRSWGVDQPVADTFYRDGRQGVDDNNITSGLLRLTYQVTQKNKISAYVDRIRKFRGHQMSAREDPETGAGRRDPVLYYMAQAKWVSTVSSKLLLEAGYSSNIENYTVFYQPGIRKPQPAGLRTCLITPCAWEPGYDQTTAWHAQATRTDTILGGRWGADDPEYAKYPERFVVASSASYVTGSHAFKSGFQWTFGSYVQSRTANADLEQRYRNGVADEVRVFNTPVTWNPVLNYDLGLYAQDQWTIDRLTVNAGVRLEWLNGSIEGMTVGAGRFTPARQTPEVPDTPDWFDVSPRIGVAYDLFGNARTALKFSVARYFEPNTHSFAERYDPLFLDSDTRSWRDLNGDDIAQDNEIGPPNNVNFGTRSRRRPDPDIQRPYNNEYSAGVQHELLPRLSITATYYRRTIHDLEKQDNLLVSESDYQPVQITSPLDGKPITVYNLGAAKRGLIDIVDTTSDSDQQIYNGFELSFNARLTNGGTVFGGWTMDQYVQVRCDRDNPNLRIQCDQREFDIPFVHELKLAGSYPLPLQIVASGALQSYAGNARGSVSDFMQPWLRVDYRVPRNVATDEGGTIVVPLVAPGTKWLDRWNQLDVSVKRIFRFGGSELHAQADIFNVLNSSVVLTETETWGSALGRPTRIIQARTPRLAVQLKW